MSSLWNYFSRKSAYIGITLIPKEFPYYADRAIQLLVTSNGQLEDAQVIDLFVASSIPYQEAVELLLFLPTAFCRHMLPQVDWPTYYVEQEAVGKNNEIYYISNARYTAIQAALLRYLASEFTQQDYLKIAARDASFKGINSLLLAGSQLENVEVSPEVVIR